MIATIGRMRTGLLWLAASLAALSSACVGQVGDPGEAPGSGPQCDEGPIAGPAPIRRMTRFEYNRTVDALLGDATNPAVVFGAEEDPIE